MNQSRPDTRDDLAVRCPPGGARTEPWRPAADIAREIARLRPHLTGLADELRDCLTDPAEDRPAR